MYGGCVSVSMQRMEWSIFYNHEGKLVKLSTPTLRPRVTCLFSAGSHFKLTMGVTSCNYRHISEELLSDILLAAMPTTFIQTPKPDVRWLNNSSSKIKTIAVTNFSMLREMYLLNGWWGVYKSMAKQELFERF